eukprot:scaffold668153_cov61-Prasinocladus_malaysianus.AAC.1
MLAGVARKQGRETPYVVNTVTGLPDRSDCVELLVSAQLLNECWHSDNLRGCGLGVWGCGLKKPSFFDNSRICCCSKEHDKTEPATGTFVILCST